MNEKNKKINILYLCEGSNYAGAESYTLNLIDEIIKIKEVNAGFCFFYRGLLGQLIRERSIVHKYLYGKNNFKSIRAILNIVKAKNIMVIHFTDLKSTIVGGLASFFCKNVKTIVTMHGLPEISGNILTQIKYKISLSLYYIIVKYFVDKIIIVSNDLKNRLKFFSKNKNVHVIHNGIAIEKSYDEVHTKKSEKKNDKFVIGCVGRLDDVKGHTYLIESAAMLKKTGIDFKIEIFGDGPLREKLLKKTNESGLNAFIFFKGFEKNIKQKIDDINLFVLPSLHEGIPYSLLEAMSMSKPIICSEVGGLKEIIKNEVEGILVKPGDSKALYKNLLRIICEPMFAKKLGDNARRKVETEFNAKTMALNTLQVYESAITN